MNTIEIKTQKIERIEKEGTKMPEKTATDYPDNDRIKESMDFKLKFDNVKDRVKSIIKGDKYARKNYLWLDILYYVKMGMLKLITPLEDFNKANSPETINRAFRKLISETSQGLHPDLKYLLEEDIRNFKERQKQEDNFEDMFMLEKNGKIAKKIK